MPVATPTAHRLMRERGEDLGAVLVTRETKPRGATRFGTSLVRHLATSVGLDRESATPLTGHRYEPTHSTPARSRPGGRGGARVRRGVPLPVAGAMYGRAHRTVRLPISVALILAVRKPTVGPGS
eukprot:4766103-Prymnesium_polylepis.1